MPVTYGSTTLTPAPLVTINKASVYDNDKLSHYRYNITLNGTIVNVGSSLDSPDAQSYGFGDMRDIQQEQDRIKDGFAINGETLTISSPDGSANQFEATCNVESISFEESTWTTRCDYSIVLYAEDYTGTEIDNGLDQTDETWSFEQSSQGPTSVTHQLNATGKLYAGGPDPLISAQLWCSNRKYSISNSYALSTSHPSGLNFGLTISNVDDTASNFYNYYVSETAGPVEYSWSLTENFVYYPSGTAREEWSITEDFNSEQQNSKRYNIQGSIFGFSDGDINIGDKLSNANTMWGTVSSSLYSRVNAIVSSGYTVNPTPLTTSVTRNHGDGSIQYSYSYDSTLGNVIDGTINESISIVDTGHIDVFAQIRVPGRLGGPVIQGMGTTDPPTRAVNIELLMQPSSSGISVGSLYSAYLNKPDVSAILEALKPDSAFYYLTGDTENWNPFNRRYTRAVSWLIQPDGTTLSSSGTYPSGIPSSPHNPSGV